MPERLRPKIPRLRRALRSRVTQHHQCQLKALMRHVAHLEELIEDMGDRIALAMAPYTDQLGRL